MESAETVRPHSKVLWVGGDTEPTNAVDGDEWDSKDGRKVNVGGKWEQLVPGAYFER